MNDEFKKAVLLWPATLGLLAVAFATIGEATGTKQHEIWAQLAAGSLLSLFVATFFGVPLVQTSRRRRTLEQLVLLFSRARYLETITLAQTARRLWPDWEGPTYLMGSAELVLWRVDAARRSFGRLLMRALEPAEEREVFLMALIAAELAGDAERAREKIERARLPGAQLLLPNLIRAARERDHALVVRLVKQQPEVPRVFQPLVDVLCAWAEEEAAPRPIDKIALLGETGLEQIDKVWPDLADFVRRAPAARSSGPGT